MTEPVPDWMQRLNQQDIAEGFMVKLLKPEGRSFIWWLCREYKCLTNGVMGQACTLLERYLAKMSLKLLCTPPRLLVKRRNQVNFDLTSRVPLLASVCIALTTKMITAEHAIELATIQRVLLRLRLNFPIEMIKETELDVYATLNYYVPLYTNVEKAMMMAEYIGMTSPELLHAVSLVTDFAEYYRFYIEPEVINAYIMSTEQTDPKWRRHVTINVKHTHLVAGAVVATRMYLTLNGPDPVARLCLLTQASKLYINCVANIIHKRLISNFWPRKTYGEPSAVIPTDEESSSDEDSPYWQPTSSKRRRF